MLKHIILKNFFNDKISYKKINGVFIFFNKLNGQTLYQKSTTLFFIKHREYMILSYLSSLFKKGC